MIWSDTDIIRGQLAGTVTVRPFEEVAVQPASLDLRLGKVFYRFKRLSLAQRLLRRSVVLDPRWPVSNLMERVECSEILLPPQGFLLGVTREEVSLSNRIVARVEGKSSLGRIGLSVHTTAGFIDPGFTGFITLELSNQSPYPIRLYPGMWIAQLAFMPTLSACIAPYGHKSRDSRYGNQSLSEPVPSRVHENHA